MNRRPLKLNNETQYLGDALLDEHVVSEFIVCLHLPVESDCIVYVDLETGEVRYEFEDGNKGD